VPTFRLTINDRPQTLDVPADMPLLWALRDVLNLTGTKYGCGIGECGACTVHVDGLADRACQLTMDRLDGRRVTTIEGLSPDARHPLQQAWLAEDVPQCGYCQAGQLMQSAALLAKSPSPTDADIDTEMAGNLCRCGTYQRIRAAVHRAAALATG